MFKILAGLTILAAVLGGLILKAAPVEEASAKTSAESDVYDSEILAASLQISMQALLEGEPVIANGLGTLIQGQDETLIVTHNHWGAVLQDTSMIEFRDAHNTLLVRTMGIEFNQLVRYQDQGTLILAAPAALLEKVPASAPLAAVNVDQLPEGTVVQVAYRQPGQRVTITLQAAEVEQQCLCSGIPGLHLRSLDGQPLQKGDSGGGVFLNGALVANNWVSVTADTPEEIAGAGALLQVGDIIYTDQSYAASLPAGQP
ncbi:MAG: hypothetical protein ACK2UW_03730 [Anaerolineales bacterium]